MSKPSPRGAARNNVECLEPRRLLSDVVAVGPLLRVNTFTTGIQTNAAVAMDASGDFVVAWNGSGPAGDYEIYAQRYGSAGAPQGAEFRVNTYTAAEQGYPSVATGADGDFVVVWHGAGAGDNSGVFAQRYDVAGVPLGGEFRVNTHTTSNQGYPAVAMDAEGDFVVAWDSDDQAGIYAQRYDASGAPQGGEFRVNTYTAVSQATIATDADGDFVVAWNSFGQDGYFYGVYAQRYNSAGVPQGGEFRVNTYTTRHQYSPSAAMDAAGNFVVTWTSHEQDGSSWGIYAQRYDASGAPQGAEFRVNTHTTNAQEYGTVAMDATGDFVVTWMGQGANGSGTYAQRYDAAGVARGLEFRVAGSFWPAVAMDADGDFVVVSEGGSDIHAQRYAVVPGVMSSSFHFATAPHTLSFTFDRDVSASLGSDDLVVQNLTTMQTIPATDFSASYDTATNVVTFTYTGTAAGIPGMLPDGRYTATLVAAGVTTVQGAPLAADVVLNFRFLQGDANNDGRINLADFNVLAANFGQSPRDFTQGDFDYSGNVNLTDFNLLAARFGQVLAAPSARPSSAATDGSRRRDAWLDELLE